MAESTVSKLRERLNRLLRQHDLAAQKAQILEEQAVRDRQREGMLGDVVHQLMERHREMNVMLNRANLMLHRAQEANAILSLEFTELCHALPAPESPDVKDRIQRINELFKKTGIDDAEVVEPPAEPDIPSVIVTPPPDQTTTPPAHEVIVEAAVEEAVEELETEETLEPAHAAPSIERLFRRSGDGEADTEAESFAEPEAPAEKEKEPVLARSGHKPEADGADVRDRRWWQLLGRRQ